MMPISMNYFVASRASSIAAPSPVINFIVRIAITLPDSAASNTKEMNIEYLQERRQFANNRLNGSESFRAVEGTF